MKKLLKPVSANIIIGFSIILGACVSIYNMHQYNNSSRQSFKVLQSFYNKKTSEDNVNNVNPSDSVAKAFKIYLSDSNNIIIDWKNITDKFNKSINNATSIALAENMIDRFIRDSIKTKESLKKAGNDLRHRLLTINTKFAIGALGGFNKNHNETLGLLNGLIDNRIELASFLKKPLEYSKMNGGSSTLYNQVTQKLKELNYEYVIIRHKIEDRNKLARNELQKTLKNMQ